MKKILSIILALVAIGLYQCVPENKTTETVEISGFDSTKAANFGADQYGMKRYVMALLKVGPNRNQTDSAAQELQRAHMANIDRMAEEGKLVVAGPFLGDSLWKGIYIFNVETIEEAVGLTQSDPAIKAGRLVMEMKEWYGSAALMGVNEVHQQLAKSNP